MMVLYLRLSRLMDVRDVPHAFTFASLQGALSVAWSLPTAVIPILALDRMGSAQMASVFFFAVSLAGLAAALTAPFLVERLGRRRVFGLGGLLVAAGGVVFPFGGSIGLVLGMIGYVFGFFCLDLGFSVAFMERIPRRALARFEPLRIVFMGGGFVIGPWLGVRLNLDVALWLPFVSMSVITLATTVYTLRRNLIDGRAARQAPRRTPNPVRFVPRYARQPRLRLAWLLAFVRSSWWTMFFIYAPIFCVEYGLGEGLAGLILSIGSAFMLLVPFWGRIGRRIGLRPLLAIGYFGTGAFTIAVAIGADWPTLGITLLLGAALLASLIDTAGNTLFMRAVHPHERPEMAAVFATYREIAKVSAPGLFAVLLTVFSLPAVFAVAGAGMMAGGWFTRFIPRRY